MALLLGGFVLIGLQPGLPMITRDLDITYSIIWSLAVANVLGAVICIVLAPQISKLTRVPYSNIGPIILAIIIFTAYQATQSWGDVIGILLLGVFGLLLKRFEWPRPALVIGFVLAQGLEGNFYRTVQVYGLDFLGRTQSLVIFALILISLFLGFKAIWATAKAKEDDTFKPARRLPQVLFTVALIGLVTYVPYELLGTASLTYLYPVTIATITGVLLVIILARQVLSDMGDPILSDNEQMPSAASQAKILPYIGWLVGLMLSVWVLGYILGITLFLISFISIENGWRPVRSLAMVAGTAGVLTLISYSFALSYPEGLLPRLIDAPWWLQ